MIPEQPFNPDKVYEIDLDAIFPDEEFNSRGMIDPTTVLELAKSIADRGLDQPITVQPWSITSKPKIRFRIVAGYRRYKAHRMNRASTIRALVKEGLSDVDARILNLTENLHRSDLNPKQEAHAIGHLKDLGVSQPEVARRIGKSRGWVQERYYLLEMPEEVQDDVAAGLVSLKDIRKAASLESTEEIYEFIKKVKDAKLKGNKRDVKTSSVKTLNEKRVRGREEIFEMQDIIRETFGGRNCFVTRMLSWAAGEISDLEAHRAILAQAQKHNKYYSIPDGFVDSID